MFCRHIASPELLFQANVVTFEFLFILIDLNECFPLQTSPSLKIFNLLYQQSVL